LQSSSISTGTASFPNSPYNSKTLSIMCRLASNRPLNRLGDRFLRLLHHSIRHISPRQRLCTRLSRCHNPLWGRLTYQFLHRRTTASGIIHIDLLSGSWSHSHSGRNQFLIADMNWLELVNMRANLLDNSFMHFLWFFYLPTHTFVNCGINWNVLQSDRVHCCRSVGDGIEMPGAMGDNFIGVFKAGFITGSYSTTALVASALVDIGTDVLSRVFCELMSVFRATRWGISCTLFWFVFVFEEKFLVDCGDWHVKDIFVVVSKVDILLRFTFVGAEVGFWGNSLEN